MSASHTISGLEELYQAVQEAHPNEAPETIAVVGEDGTVVYSRSQ